MNTNLIHIHWDPGNEPHEANGALGFSNVEKGSYNMHFSDSDFGVVAVEILGKVAKGGALVNPFKDRDYVIFNVQDDNYPDEIWLVKAETANEAGIEHLLGIHDDADQEEYVDASDVDPNSPPGLLESKPHEGGLRKPTSSDSEDDYWEFKDAKEYLKESTQKTRKRKKNKDKEFSLKGLILNLMRLQLHLYGQYQEFERGSLEGFNQPQMGGDLALYNHTFQNYTMPHYFEESAFPADSEVANSPSIFDKIMNTFNSILTFPGVNAGSIPPNKQETSPASFLYQALNTTSVAQTCLEESVVADTASVFLEEYLISPEQAASPLVVGPVSSPINLQTDQKSNAPSRICLVTSFTTDNPVRTKMSEAVAQNQGEYAKERGYQQIVYRENLAREVDPETGQEIVFEPYWSKIAAVIRILEGKETGLQNGNPEWIVWLDDDALVTNFAVGIEDVIKLYSDRSNYKNPFRPGEEGYRPHTKLNLGAGDPNFIVTTDAISHASHDIPLNTGVMLIKNTPWSLDFFKKVWAMRNQKVGDHDYTYGTCKNQECLHEQQAITELLFLEQNVDLREHARVVPQRMAGLGVNTFMRWSHMDGNRSMYLDYEVDKHEFKWISGDFIGQCTGLSPQLRAHCIDYLQAQQEVEKGHFDKAVAIAQTWMNNKKMDIVRLSLMVFNSIGKKGHRCEELILAAEKGMNLGIEYLLLDLLNLSLDIFTNLIESGEDIKLESVLLAFTYPRSYPDEIESKITVLSEALVKKYGYQKLIDTVLNTILKGMKEKPEEVLNYMSLLSKERLPGEEWKQEVLMAAENWIKDEDPIIRVLAVNVFSEFVRLRLYRVEAKKAAEIGSQDPDEKVRKAVASGYLRWI